MENENFVNAYIEILTNTMTDAVIRNVSLQANLKINESIIEQQAKTVEQFRDTIRALEQENENLKTSKIGSENSKIKELEEQVQLQLNTISTFQPKIDEYENVKAQANHINTFRNELIKEREEHERTRNDYNAQIKALKDKIDYLQLTPAKRKKVEQTKTTNFVVKTDTLKDGGEF